MGLWHCFFANSGFIKHVGIRAQEGGQLLRDCEEGASSSQGNNSMANKNLTRAKRAKNDEFYTQFVDIQKEIEAYLEYNPDVFRGQAVYCNCDDPYESNFFRYFALNFNKLGLRQLITTSYKPSLIANTQLELFELGGEDAARPKGRPKVTANKFIINQVPEMDEDGELNLRSIAMQLKANKQNKWAPLEGDGDFRSDECIALLKQADIVVTNPPFSLFREFVRQLVEHDKLFLIIGNMNAITYKEIFPLIMGNKLWLGPSISSGDREFQVPESYPIEAAGWRVDAEGRKFLRIKGVRWFTNLDHGRRHQPLPLMTMQDNLKFSKHKELRGKTEYQKYDNYDAIEVPFTDAIPSDYDGAMGVPISFLDKYCPEQFEILGITDRDNNSGLKTKEYSEADAPNFGDLNRRGAIRIEDKLVSTYARMLICHRRKKEEMK
jgi:hypothetical protein